ncbi:MAG TPA: IPT/TIG domain-containing protein, partial [Candidatus Methylomirabilis sp.]|nr:IPT/TIG domain-containing protein [Candidatus Methylomirabilis sp.]
MATATSGALSHPANLALSVQPGVVANLPRTTYIRTDSIPSLDDPAGEPHHRHLVYDAAQQLVFAANRAMNRVEILSASTAQRAGQLSVPGASSADLSADGSTIWVGAVTETVAAIDTASLQIKARYEIAGLQPLPSTLFDRPEEILALSSGKLMMRLRQSQTGEALLALWDPSSNTLTNLTSTAPQLFQNGLGVMARSGDHTRVLVAANDSSGEIAVYDANGSLLAGPHGLGAGIIPLAAANLDGTRFAVEFVANGVTQIQLLDGAFNVAGTYSATAVNGMVFSTDGQSLYVSENSGAPPIITALDGHSASVVGQVPDLWIAGRRSEIEDVDATHLLFGLTNRGVSFLDGAHPVSLPTTAPSLGAPPVAQPSEGLAAGGTSTVLSGQNFEPSAQLLFGGQFAANVTVTSSTQLSAISPANSAAGVVNLTAYFPSGWLALAPDAFSYGPQILRVLPNASSPAGGDVVQIYGYGFGSDATKITATIGGANATIQKLENVTTIAPSLGLDATYPFPIERLTVQTPPGASGKADIVVTSSSGSTTASKAFEFLQSETFYPKPSFDKFVLYDKGRQWL